MPFPYLNEIKELNQTTRAEATGSFVALSDGITHYELGGPTNGFPVVLVHGFSVPSFIFDPTFDFLCKQGVRVLRYDLFGRGYSDRPHARYDIALFVRQLKELLEALHLEKVDLVGLSMGGPITAAFIDEHPEHVSKHILIDPAGAKAVSLSLLLDVVKTPLVGELLLGLFGSASLIKGIASDLFTPELVKEFQEKYKTQMQYQGFKRAILSTMRSGMLASFLEVYTRVGSLEKPTLLVWGRYDKTIPIEYSAEIQKAIPHAAFRVIEDCGHIPHYEKPSEFNPILLEFLRQKDRPHE